MKHLLCTILGLGSLGFAWSQVADNIPSAGLIFAAPLNGSAAELVSNDGIGIVESDVLYVLDDSLQREVAEFNDFSSQIEYKPVGPQDELTVALWVQFQDFDDIGQVISMNDGRMSIVFNDNNESLDVMSGTAWQDEFSAGIVDFFVPNVTFENQWRHITATFGNDSTSLFVDAQFITSGPSSESPFDTNILLGNRIFSSSLDYNFGGLLRDVFIWNRVLSPAEILTVVQPYPGCMDEAACNFDAVANYDNGSCVYSGCSDASACNFNGADICDIDCVYPAIDGDCTAGEALCGPGTYWDDASQNCKVTIPGDIDFSGCLSVDDLLGSLAIYNLCFDTEAIAFTCGVNVVNYDGYDYQTVQIGDQCWFAENLRSTSYSDGSSIPLLLSTEDWQSQSGPAVTFRSDSVQTGLWGAYYNWESLVQEASVCPIGWHAPSHLEWSELEIALGMDEETAVNFGDRGGIPDVPIALSTIGTNSSGFSAIGAGFRYEHGGWDPNYTAFWTTTEDTNPLKAVSRKLFYLQNKTAVPDLKTWGLSVRCLQDAE